MNADATVSPASHSEGAAPTATLRLVISYAAPAILWLLLSDNAVAWLFSDPARIVVANTLKSLLFVAVTSLLLHRLVRRLLGQTLAASRREFEAQAQTSRALQLVATVADNSSDAIFAKDLEGRYLLFNREAARVLGNTDAQALGRDDMALYPPEQAKKIRADDRHVIAGNQIIASEETLFTAEGKRTYFATKGPLRDGDGRVIGIFGISRDISARKVAEDRVQYLAQFDALTDLPNRALLTDRLNQALAQVRRDKSILASILVDLDKFRPVNDTLGRDIGDLLLKQAATRIHACLRRESDTLARVGGDEFVILLARVRAVPDTLVVVEQVLAALNQPFRIGPYTINISSSIGIAVFPQHGEDAQQLLNSADEAMQEAKKSGRNCYRFCSANTGA